jgi:hypothetical protein
VDGYNGIWSGTGANRVSATFYLNDVAEQGGCFTYWKVTATGLARTARLGPAL